MLTKYLRSVMIFNELLKSSMFFIMNIVHHQKLKSLLSISKNLQNFYDQLLFSK